MRPLLVAGGLAQLGQPGQRIHRPPPHLLTGDLDPGVGGTIQQHPTIGLPRLGQRRGHGRVELGVAGGGQGLLGRVSKVIATR
jgi:hypothetical protein